MHHPGKNAPRECGMLSQQDVITGLGPVVRALLVAGAKDVDGRVKPGHDERKNVLRGYGVISSAVMLRESGASSIPETSR